MALKALSDAGVILHADATAQKVAEKFGIPSTVATDENWCTEYGILEMNVGVVDSVEAAADHIAKYGTNHTEAIVTENKANADRFIALSDCAAVMVIYRWRTNGLWRRNRHLKSEVACTWANGVRSYDHNHLDRHWRWANSQLTGLVIKLNPL
jgi:hypothetical protein